MEDSPGAPARTPSLKLGPGPDEHAADRERFIATAARLAAEVYDFHDRWALETGTPLEVMRRRMPMLDEEVRELRAEVNRAAPGFDEAAMSEEAADVLFVALGHMEQLGAAGLAGMDAVTAKNIAKTSRSHSLHPETGKVTRRNRPEQNPQKIQARNHQKGQERPS